MSRSDFQQAEPTSDAARENGSARPPQTKKLSRRQRRALTPASLEVEDAESSDQSPSSRSSTSSRDTSIPLLLTSAADSASMPLFSTARSIPVFVASIGNPKPYEKTLHSIGHLVLANLARSHSEYHPWTAFQKGSITDGKGKTFSLLRASHTPATGTELPTLWKSGAMMNISGPAVKRAWNAWLKDRGFGKDEAKLIIVHDELERSWGDVSIKVDHRASAKGHNGIKSLQSAFQSEPFIRVGVGIGRPAARDPDTVSRYVLRPLTQKETDSLEESAKRVWQAIAEIEEGAIG